MDNGTQRILAFLADIGVEARIGLDLNHERVITIPTEQFEKHRETVKRWFTLVGQEREFSVFRERMRGTGNTE